MKSSERLNNSQGAWSRPKGMAVVLVEPENPANIGFIIRTMACYGVLDCRIVGRPGMGLTEAAKKTAKGAPKLLESIRYFDTLSSAIADCHFALGFTRRIREPAQQFQNIQEMVAEWNQANTEPTKTALVFGRESQGLSREESLLVSHLVCIPMMGENLSLNLSHAVAIALYAFLGSTLPDALSMDSKSTRNAHLPIQQENNAVLDHLLQTLDAKGFFRSGKESAHRDYTRVLWQRLRPTRQELDFLAGMLKRLSVPS